MKLFTKSTSSDILGGIFEGYRINIGDCFEEKPREGKGFILGSLSNDDDDDDDDAEDDA